eukprot:Clim_evm59s203 gene=Clim_evmTU59s203
MPTDPQEEVRLVQEVKGILGCDAGTARKFLEASDWNSNAAVELFFAAGEDGLEAGGSAPAVDADGVRAPIAKTSGILVEDVPGLPGLLNPARNRIRYKKKKTNTAFDGTVSDKSKGSKASLIADLFKPPEDVMYDGDLESAREEGKTSGKNVMVNLQDSKSFDSYAMNRDIWRIDIVKTLIREKFLFMQVDKETEEGQTFVQRYRINAEPPVVCVIEAETGARLVTFKELKDSLKFCEEVESWLRSQNSRKRKTDTLYDMSEEAQMAAAVAASLAAADPGNETKKLKTTAKDRKERSPSVDSEGWASYSASFESSDDEAAAGDDEEAEAKGTVKEERVEEKKDLIGLGIQPLDPPGADVAAELKTRVQVRLPNNKRLVLPCMREWPIKQIFARLRAENDQLAKADFELRTHNEVLNEKADATLEDANVLNAALTVSFK